MPLPTGQIVHSSSQRLRIRIPAQRNNFEFFKKLKNEFQSSQVIDEFQVNAQTGSILFSGTLPKINELSDFVRTNHLFTLETGQTAKPLKTQIYTMFTRINHRVEDASGDTMDLPILLFLTLVGTGIYQILRSEVRLPPWYTAFWYGLGIFTKSLTDTKKDLLD